MTHVNAPLTPTGRLRLARCIIEDGWPLRRAAERFQVSVSTAARWAGRYRDLGEAGMYDRSSRPHTSPNQTPTRTERRIIKVRVLRRWGPARIAYLLGLNPSTVHRVLPRYGWPACGTWTGPPAGSVRRYEHDRTRRSGARGHQEAGQHPRRRRPPRSRPGCRRPQQLRPPRPRPAPQAQQPRQPRLQLPAQRRRRPLPPGLHRDPARRDQGDRGRVLGPGPGVLRRCGDHRRAGPDRQRVLLPLTALARHAARRAIVHKRTRPYRPQTNGKVERFNRTLLDEWAYDQPYRSETERREALPGWLHTYNHHRGHTALAGKPPASRVPNLTGQNS